MKKQSYGLAGWLFALAFMALAPIRSANAQCEPAVEVPGVNGPVSAMVNWDPDGAGPLPPVLVVGGSFSVAGTVVTENIATWNAATGQWSALGSGLNSDFVYLSNGGVNALAVMPNGDLVAGGRFEYTGVGADAYCVKRWNGVAWSDLGSGFSDTQGVFALAVLPNGDLVAGGTLGDTGSIDVSNIARWNGSAWSDLNGGTNNNAVYALAVMPNGDLVAGGDFNFIGNPQVGVNADHIARWDGATWHEMGGGVLGGIDGTAVHSLKVLPNGELIVGGEFLVAGGQSINYIARWDGSVWSPLGTGTSYIVSALAVMPNGDVVAGGYFTGAGGFSVNYVARWNGSAWSPLGSGMNYPVLALAVLPDGDLMAGGIFNIAGGVNVERIARWNGTVWSTLTSAITASDAAAGDWFGNVAIDGNTLIVGARKDDNATGVDAGAAYVYTRSGSPGNEVWTEQAKLIGSEPIFGLETGNQSGVSVAVSGNTALVGSWLWPQGNATGLIYIFDRSGPPGSEVWTQQFALACPQFGSYQYFGVSVDLEGDTAVVGTLAATGLNVGGQAFFYRRSGPPGGQQWAAQHVFPSDGVPGDQFGISVAMSPSQDTAVVGACLEDNAGGADAGSAYVFVRTGNNWTEQAKLTASDGATLDEFGRQVAIDGDTIVVGARFDDHAGGANAGSAYVFTRTDSVWTQQAKLTASDAAAGDEFGLVLTLSGNRIIVGAFSDDHAGGVDAGSAYVFTRSGTVWTEQFKLIAPDASPGDAFGTVALSGDTAVISSIFDDHAGGADAGSVYVFDLGCGNVACCVGDFDGSNGVTIADVPDFVAALLSGGACPAAPACCPGDLNADGVMNGRDVRSFVAKLLAGGACP